LPRMKKSLLTGALALFVAQDALAAGGGNAFGKSAREDAETAVRLSAPHVRALAVRNGAAEADLKTARIDVDGSVMAHHKVQQTADGIPVWGGEAIVHLNADGSLFAVTDNLKPNVRAPKGLDRVGEQGAIDLAVKAYGCSDCLTAAPLADRWVLRQRGRDLLAWRVQLRREDGTDHTAMPVLFVDAATGDVVKRYDNLQTDTGSSLYSGTVTIATSVSGTTRYMEDTVKKIGTFDNRNTPSTNQGAGSTYRFTNTSTSWTGTTQRAGVDAHYGATKTYDYFKNVHGRNGIDGSGGPGYYTSAVGGVGLITSKVHYGVRYNNAYWNGQFMTYGDGDGTNFTPLVTLDIAGHEITHGVTERTAGLVYEREPGALNESMSDVFGAMVERYTEGESSNTWKIGEDAYTPATAGDALRFMDNPPGAGDPDHYSEALYLNDPVCDPQTNDVCGVHINSGIPNKVFYLVAKGGVHPNTPSVTVTGIGADAAAAIWYRALTSYMTSGTTFSGARTATLNAASAIHGASSSQYTAVCQAWYAAGVGAACSGGGGGGTELLLNGGFDTSTTSWTRGASILHSTSGGQSAGYVYNSNVNNLSTGNTIYQQVTIPSTATGTLTFSTYITTQESTTDTTAWDKLFVEVRNTSGTLLGTLATYSNLNRSTGWTARSLSLAAYKGQTVRIQFRVTTDTTLPTVFRVDTVSAK
jgi:Zn-dependent metalloprotease